MNQTITSYESLSITTLIPLHFLFVCLLWLPFSLALLDGMQSIAFIHSPC